MAQSTIGKFRWTICGLIFFATTINYLDRAVISLLKDSLEKEFNWTEDDYSNLVIAFQVSYAIGLLGVGRLIESMVFTKEKQEALGINLGKVGWFVGFQIDDVDVWKKIETGEYVDFSIGGTGQREQIAA